MTPVAVVDIGTNSTRLLVAEVDKGGVRELDRRSIVTRLGEGVDAAGALGDAPQERVFAVLEEYAAAIASREPGGSPPRRATASSPRSRTTPRRSTTMGASAARRS